VLVRTNEDTKKMSQEEIIKFLKKVNRPVDIKELMINFPTKSRVILSRNCRILRKYNEVKFKKVKEKYYLKYIYYL